MAQGYVKPLFLAALGGYLILKAAVVLNLKHFKVSEFGFALPFLAIGLLEKLDKWRDNLGSPVAISSAEGATIRFGDGTSQHYFGRAVDVILSTGESPRRAVELARLAGFKGIGVYPNSAGIKGRTRLHLDDRPSNRVATWGFINGSYTDIDTALSIAEG